MGFGVVITSEERETGRAKVEVRLSKLNNGNAAGKEEKTGEIIKVVEATGWWIGSVGYVIRPLRVVLCPKIGDLL